MEKYRDWVDASTGLNPWPPLYKKNPNGALRIFAMTIGVLLAPARLLLFLALLLVAFLFDIAKSILGILPVIGRLVTRVLDLLAAHLMLIAIGVWPGCARWQDFTKQASRAAPADRKNQVATSPNGGDVVVCNWTSYSDVLYLAAAFSPIFAIPVADSKSGAPTLAAMSFFGALRASMGHARPTTGEPLDAIVARGKSRGAPVVVFSEGVRTNGQCVLAMMPFVGKVELGANTVHMIGFKHTTTFASLPFTAGSVWGHLFHVCRQLYSSFNVRYMGPQCVPAYKDSESFSIDLTNNIAARCQMKPVKSCAADKAEFLDFFDSGKKVRKTRIGQGGRAIANEGGKAMPQQNVKGMDHAVLRMERLAAKKQQEEDDEKAWNSDEDAK